MCGLVGFIGTSSCKEPILRGLSRLEYRGYDSAGLAVLLKDRGTLEAVHAVGELDVLKKKLQHSTLDGFVGIGHTRWATHGPPSLTNCHPHRDCHNTIVLAHNGIIENFQSLKQELASTHQFTSETDTEVVVHLLESLLLSRSTLQEAIAALAQKLEGSFAITILLRAYPELLIALRKRSPVCIGVGKHARYVASDQLAFAGDADRMVLMPDESFAFVSQDQIELYDFQGNQLRVEHVPVTVKVASVERGNFEHFMLKEIYEQKKVIQHTAREYTHSGAAILQHMGMTQQDLKKITSLHIIACGTSWHAGLIAKYFFEEIAGIKTEVHLASEFRYARLWLEPHSLYLAISQSGETADTLEALRMVKKAGGRTVVLTNVATSTMVREADGYLPMFAGAEIAVASTKAFSGQLAALYALAHLFGAYKKDDTTEQSKVERDLLVAAQILEDAIEQHKETITSVLAPRYARYDKILFVGRQESYVMALEAALKLKEISYIFADAVPAGELKHGSLALVDENTPVILYSSLDSLIYKKLLSCAQEIKARPSRLLTIAFEGQHELADLADDVLVIPRVSSLLGPIAQAGFMQFFAYEIARMLGRPIDKPRNLAKSVTVE